MVFKMRHCGSVAPLLLALLFAAGTAQAQCKTGQQRQPKGTQPTIGLLQQQIAQIPQQLITFGGLQQQSQLQPPYTLVGYPRKQTNALLIALGQQRSQNDSLIAVSKKQENTFQSFQTGRTNGFPTAREDQQFFNTLQAALQQTQVLLTLLGQQNAVVTQNDWLNTLQRQFTLLTELGQQYAPQSSD